MASNIDRTRMIDDGFLYIDQVRSAIVRIDRRPSSRWASSTTPERAGSATATIASAALRAVIEPLDRRLRRHSPLSGRRDRVRAADAELRHRRSRPETDRDRRDGSVYACRSGQAEPQRTRSSPGSECRVRAGIDGWLLWTWDTDEQPDLWNAQSGGDVEQAGRSH